MELQTLDDLVKARRVSEGETLFISAGQTCQAPLRSIVKRGGADKMRIHKSRLSRTLAPLRQVRYVHQNVDQNLRAQRSRLGA